MMIKLCLVDVDGTLTDGLYHVDENGLLKKSFNTRDFHGLWMLNESGVKIGIISMSSDPVIKRQCNRCAKYAEVHIGVRDKLSFVQEVYGVPMRNIAYIGDDLIDIPLLEKVGYPGCPSDAVHEVAQTVTSRHMAERGATIMDKSGGKGAVREFAEAILDYNDWLKGRKND